MWTGQCIVALPIPDKFLGKCYGGVRICAICLEIANDHADGHVMFQN